MACRFSKDGKYFGQLSNDSKLKIWHTASNKFVQEFTPDVHLTAPCTCLHFIQSPIGTSKPGSPRKKIKRRNSIEEDTYTIALGTTSGTILLYSIDNAELLDTISSDTNYNITCITHQDGDILYSGAEQYILQWNLSEKVMKQRWKSGNEGITAILKVPGLDRLLTAARLIKLWDTQTKQLLKSFTGHKSEITSMDYISPQEGQSYIISGSKSDRTLSCWNLCEETKNKNAVATFLLEDSLRSVNIMLTDEGLTYVTATVINGGMHIFEYILNGKCTKPLKPKTTIKIASTSADKDGQVKPIPIVSGFILEKSITISYGTSIFLTFECIALDLSEKTQCLIRSNLTSIESKRKDKKSKKTSQVVETIIDNVTYLTPHTSISKAAKRQKDGGTEIAMEKRLENLTVAASAFNTSTTSTISGTPQTNNVAQLLVQGLHSEDKEILRTVLCGQQHKDQVIINTVRRLKMPVIQLLVAELVKMLQNRSNSSQTGAVWLKHILHCHSGLLLANPELVDLLSPALNAIESRLKLALPFQRLQGRLDLIMSQIDKQGGGGGSIEGGENEQEALVVYDDKALSDDDLAAMDVTGAGSDSDMEEWNEDDDNSNSDEDDDSDKDDDNMRATGVTENGRNDSESEVEIIEDEDMSS